MFGLRIYLLVLVIVVTGVPVYAFAQDGFNVGHTIAQFENTTYGVVNMAPSIAQQVQVSSTEITGYAWGDVVGWINFSPTNGGVTVSCQTNNTATLSGYAWGENTGWVNFAPSTAGVTIDSEGYFDGDAWSESYGWISFDKTVCTTLGGPGNDTTPVTGDGDGYSGGCVRTDFRCGTSSGGTGSSSGSAPTTPIIPDLVDSANSTVVPVLPPITLPPILDTVVDVVQDTVDTFVTVITTLLDPGPHSVPPDIQPTTLPTDPIFAPRIPSEQCPVFPVDLIPGAMGPEVVRVQKFLQNQGYELLITGVYDQPTISAVYSFQNKQYRYAIFPAVSIGQFFPNGQWNALTRSVANTMSGCPSAQISVRAQNCTTISLYRSAKHFYTQPIVDTEYTPPETKTALLDARPITFVSGKAFSPDTVGETCISPVVPLNDLTAIDNSSLKIRDIVIDEFRFGITVMVDFFGRFVDTIIQLF